MDTTHKPKCRLVGTDGGNVFALGGRVTQALRAAGQPEKAKEFSERLFKCNSYVAAVALMSKYVEIS